jgi:hypothetical protein
VVRGWGGWEAIPTVRPLGGGAVLLDGHRQLSRVRVEGRGGARGRRLGHVTGCRTPRCRGYAGRVARPRHAVERLREVRGPLQYYLLGQLVGVARVPGYQLLQPLEAVGDRRLAQRCEK